MAGSRVAYGVPSASRGKGEGRNEENREIKQGTPTLAGVEERGPSYEDMHHKVGVAVRCRRANGN